MAERTDFRVILSEDAIVDLSDIGRWIAERSDLDTANAYVARVQAACDRLSFLPNRGTPRFDVAPGLRTVAFERRDIICFRVEGEDVTSCVSFMALAISPPLSRRRVLHGITA